MHANNVPCRVYSNARPGGSHNNNCTHLYLHTSIPDKTRTASFSVGYEHHVVKAELAFLEEGDTFNCMLQTGYYGKKHVCGWRAVVPQVTPSRFLCPEFGGSLSRICGSSLHGVCSSVEHCFEGLHRTKQIDPRVLYFVN